MHATSATPDTKPRKPGTFLPGNRAAAKRKTQRSPKTTLRDVASQEELDSIVRGLVDRALAGEQASAEWVAARMLPPLKPSHGNAPFKLDLTDITSATKSVLAAISSGELNVEQGQALIGSLKGAADVQQGEQMAQRLADLEARLDKQNAAPQAATPLPVPTTPDTETALTATPTRPSWLEENAEIVADIDTPEIIDGDTPE